eukprot:418144-Amphidinium_carterae.1
MCSVRSLEDVIGNGRGSWGGRPFRHWFESYLEAEIVMRQRLTAGQTDGAGSAISALQSLPVANEKPSQAAILDKLLLLLLLKPFDLKPVYCGFAY